MFAAQQEASLKLEQLSEAVRLAEQWPGIMFPCLNSKVIELDVCFQWLLGTKWLFNYWKMSFKSWVCLRWFYFPLLINHQFGMIFYFFPGDFSDIFGLFTQWIFRWTIYFNIYSWLVFHFLHIQVILSMVNNCFFHFVSQYSCKGLPLLEVQMLSWFIHGSFSLIVFDTEIGWFGCWFRNGTWLFISFMDVDLEIGILCSPVHSIHLPATNRPFTVQNQMPTAQLAWVAGCLRHGKCVLQSRNPWRAGGTSSVSQLRMAGNDLFLAPCHVACLICENCRKCYYWTSDLEKDHVPCMVYLPTFGSFYGSM